MRIKITDGKTQQYLLDVFNNISYPQGSYPQIFIKGKIINGIDGIWIEIEEMSWVQR